MKKIACVFSYQKSNWVSCQKIVFNLHKAYEGLPQTQILNFNYSATHEIQDIHQLAQDIIAAAPDMIVFLDHKPHPLALIQSLMKQGMKELNPRVIFHIFGDFTLYYPEWEKLGNLLKETSVDFVVASERQKALIDPFLFAPNYSEICPFPVQKDEFFFAPNLREDQRNEWGLGKNEKALVFAGRLSYQKKTHTLIKAFAQALEETSDTQTHLFFYGHPDHIGDPFVGRWETEGEYFRKFYQLYQELAPAIQKRIHFKGIVSGEELKSVYQVADLLVNLSVHNDEDFGMSVAEAQASGLPSLITSWGGLASFTYPEYPEATTFVPVKIGEYSKTISRKFVTQKLVNFIKNENNFDRKKISQLALDRFSVDASRKLISEIVNSEEKPFKGFSPFFKKVLTQIQTSSTPYLNEKRQINHLYKEIYSAYV